MKKMILIFASLLIGLTTASAKELNNKTTNNINKTNHYRNAEPIVFIENGVKFLIYPDGRFNYNTINKQYSKKHVLNNSKRKHVSIKNTRIVVSRDRSGKINRIGNVHLNYDRQGKIKRVGSITIDYNRNNGVLNKVGGLYVKYNHIGKITNSRGKVNNNYTRRK